MIRYSSLHKMFPMLLDYGFQEGYGSKCAIHGFQCKGLRINISFKAQAFQWPLCKEIPTWEN